MPKVEKFLVLARVFSTESEHLTMYKTGLGTYKFRLSVYILAYIAYPPSASSTSLQHPFSQSTFPFWLPQAWTSASALNLHNEPREEESKFQTQIWNSWVSWLRKFSYSWHFLLIKQMHKNIHTHTVILGLSLLAYWNITIKV